MTRILVVGAGAVGGYFGGRLVEAGRDVTFLVRTGRAAQIRRDGLRLVSPHGDATLRPKLVEAGQIDGVYDLILLGVKGYALESAMEDLAPAVAATSTILPVLNGMRHMDRLAERFGEERILGGLCVVATELDAEGRIVQRAEVQKLAYGERDGRESSRIRGVDAALSGAGFDTTLSADIVAAMWEKWVMLASLGAACCLLHGPVGQIVAAPGGTETNLAILDECGAAAIALGHPPSPEFLAHHRAALTTPGSPLTSSMYRDLVKGAPVETDTILGDLVTRAEGAGIATPLLRATHCALSLHMAGREARRT
jgi:2-dehydropantoate 2-reductase